MGWQPVDWETLLRDRSLSYLQIARRTGRSLATVRGHAERLHLLWVRSSRKGPNHRLADVNLDDLRRRRAAGHTLRRIAADTGLHYRTLREWLKGT